MLDDTDLKPFALPPELAPLGRRSLASAIDFLITVAMFASAVLVVVLAAVTAAPPDDSASLTGPEFASGGDLVGLLLALVGIVVTWRHIGWRQGERGQTWGKQAVGIALVSKRTYDPPGRGLARALVRTVLSSICYGIYGFVTVLWRLWDEDRHTLDDKVFGTLVVRWQ